MTAQNPNGQLTIGAAPKHFAIAYAGVNRTMFRWLGLGPNKSSVTVSPYAVTVHMGWAFDASIARSEIISAARAQKPFHLGWGVHGWRGRWAVNGSDEGTLLLTIDPPAEAKTLVFPIKLRELYLSLEDPEGFLAALEM